MKLARRLTLFLLAGMVLMLTIFAAVDIRAQARLLEADTLHDHELLGRALAASALSVWKAEGVEGAAAMVDGAEAGNPELQTHFRFVDTGPVGSELPDSDWRALAGGREVHRLVDGGLHSTLISAFPIERGGVHAAVEIRESLAALDSHVRRSVGKAVLTVLGLIAVTSVLAATLGVSLVGRPMHRLVEQARRIGQGDLSGRMPIERADEIGELSLEMNAMVDRLEEARTRVDAETRARLTALEQLRHADRLTTVGKLASGVAHELGTPLNVISGRAQMISRGQVVGDAVADNARIIVQQTERMTNIIRQLLAFARVRAPTNALVELNGVATHVVELLGPLAKKRSVTLAVKADGDTVRVRGDAGQLEQVLTNLVVNAVQSMQGPGSVEIRVGHESGEAQRRVKLEVEDHGSGISPDDLEHVFEPFFTTKDVGEGTGLGLSVAYGIVREHGGSIELDSRPGIGTTVRVLLPAEAT